MISQQTKLRLWLILRNRPGYQTGHFYLKVCKKKKDCRNSHPHVNGPSCLQQFAKWKRNLLYKNSEQIRSDVTVQYVSLSNAILDTFSRLFIYNLFIYNRKFIQKYTSNQKQLKKALNYFCFQIICRDEAPKTESLT